MKRNSIGIVELTSVAAGFAVADAMLKAAHVELLVSRSICSGKYLVMVGGEVAEVKAAVRAAGETGSEAIVDTTVLTSIHEEVFPAVTGGQPVAPGGALGVIEGFSAASVVEAADAAVKAGEVRIIEIRLAMALGGKAFVTLTGAVEAVESAVEAGAAVIAEKGLLVNKVVIPRPQPELFNEII